MANATTPTIFERQLLSNALHQLETTGLVMVPAEQVNAVWQSFAKHSALTVEVGVVGENEHHSPKAVYECLQDPQREQVACWLRVPRILREREGRKVEAVEVESNTHARELLATYRTVGLEYGDELALMRYINRRPSLFRLSCLEAARLDDLKLAGLV